MQLSRQNSLALALSAIVVLLGVDLWRVFDPHTTDFAAFYSSARLWSEGRQPYDQQANCEVQKRASVSLCLPFNHPPILVPLVALVVNEDYTASYFRWAATNLLIVLCCGWALYKLTGNAIKTVALTCFFPVLVIVMQGQDAGFVLLGLLLCLLFLLKGSDLWAGISLGLLVVKPHWAIAVGIPLLFSRPKAFRSFCIVGVVLVLYSLMLVGFEGFRDLINVALLTAKGGDEGIRQVNMYNLVAIFVRLGVNPVLAWPFFLAAVAGVSVLWHKTGITRTSFGLAIILILFFAPHVHTHDLAMLLIPLVLCPSLIVPLASLAIMISAVHNFQQLTVFALMASLSSFLFFRLSSIEHSTFVQPTERPRDSRCE